MKEDLKYIQCVLEELSKRSRGKEYINMITSIITYINEVEGGMFKGSCITRQYDLDRLSIKMSWSEYNLTKGKK